MDTRNLIASLVLCLVILSCKDSYQDESLQDVNVTETTNPLLGAWRVNEIYYTNKDTTYSIPKAQVGNLLVTPERYAIMWVPTEAQRKPFEILSKPTDEETINGFRSVVFNSGSYTLNDSIMTTTAEIAKVPGFEGGIQFYKYAIDKDTLNFEMYDETYPDGSKPEWVGTWTTGFKMSKIQD